MCEKWRSFRELCQKVDDRLQSKARLQVPNKEPRIVIEQLVMEVNEHSDAESSIDGEVTEEDNEQSKAERRDDEDGVKCPVCDLIIPHSRPLKDHLQGHYSKEVIEDANALDLLSNSLPLSLPQNPQCPICNKIFSRPCLSAHLVPAQKRRQRED